MDVLDYEIVFFKNFNQKIILVFQAKKNLKEIENNILIYILEIN